MQIHIRSNPNLPHCPCPICPYDSNHKSPFQSFQNEKVYYFAGAPVSISQVGFLYGRIHGFMLFLYEGNSLLAGSSNVLGLACRFADSAFGTCQSLAIGRHQTKHFRLKNKFHVEIAVTIQPSLIGLARHLVMSISGTAPAERQ
jgi:hypothetical protein